MEVPDPADRSNPGRPAAGAWLPALVGLAVFLPFVARFDWLCDDAYISFRYSRNLARGLGLVFNPGDEPVEGYSNLLWVLWGAVFERLGWDVGLWLRGTSILAAVVLFWRVLRHARRSTDVLGTWAASLFLATFPPLAVWATGGLATAPLALCAFLLYEALAARPARLGGAAAAAAVLVLLRADGFVWAGMVVAAVTLAGGADGARPWRALLAAAGATALTFAALVISRLALFGDWLPQTARAKGHLSVETLERGLAYAGAHVLTFPSIAVAVAVVLLGGRARLRRAAGPLLVLAANAGYAIAAGGDFMAMGRFFVPSVGFLGLVVAAGAAGTGGAPPSRRRALRPALLTAVLVALSVLPAFDRHAVPESVRARCHFRWSSAEFWSELAMWKGMVARAEKHAVLGRALHALTPPDTSFVIGAIGAVGYYSDRFVWDQNGLVCRDVTRDSERRFRRSPGHDFFVSREFFKGRTTLAAVNVLSYETGDFLVPPRWEGCRYDPIDHPERFEQRMLVRTDADPRRVAQAARGFGWKVEPAVPEDALPPASGLLLVRWAD